MYLSKSLVRFLRCMRNGSKRLQGVNSWSNIDFSSKEMHAKDINEGSTSTNNHLPMSE
jgi:hypothetical protein